MSIVAILEARFHELKSILGGLFLDQNKHDFCTRIIDIIDRIMLKFTITTSAGSFFLHHFTHGKRDKM